MYEEKKRTAGQVMPCIEGCFFACGLKIAVIFSL